MLTEIYKDCTQFVLEKQNLAFRAIRPYENLIVVPIIVW